MHSHIFFFWQSEIAEKFYLSTSFCWVDNWWRRWFYCISSKHRNAYWIKLVMQRIGLISGEIIVYLSHKYLEINSNQWRYNFINDQEHIYTIIALMMTAVHHLILNLMLPNLKLDVFRFINIWCFNNDEPPHLI